MSDNQPDPPPLGELVRAYRTYIGMGQAGFAARLGIPEKNLSDIEVGRRSCTQKFIDFVSRTCDEFDDQVKTTIAAAENMLGGDEDRVVHLNVDDRAEYEWERAVIARAAVESSLILPILVGRYHRARERA